VEGGCVVAADTEQRLLAFLAGQLALRDHQGCIKIELEYSPSVAGYRPDRLAEWTPQSHPEFFGIFQPSAEGEDTSKLAEQRHVFTQRFAAEVHERALEYADTFDSGTQCFTVRAYKFMGGRDHHRIKIQPAHRGGDAHDQPTLDPSTQGQILQLQRHLENRDRGFREMMGAFLQSAERAAARRDAEIENMHKQIEAMQTARAGMLDRIEAANSKNHDRDVELAIVMGKRERADFAVKKLVNLAPVALSAAMRRLGPGKGAGGVNGTKKAPASPLAACLSKLAVSITDDQKAQIQNILAPEQLLSLEEIIASSLEGGGMLLPTMVDDLAKVMAQRPQQIRQLMELFTDAQRPLFVQALQLAERSVKQTEEPQASESKGEGDAPNSEASS
jgi:hypothetical protein